MLKINTVTMKEKIEEILKNSYTNFGEFDESKATKELLDLFSVSQQRELLKAFLEWQQNKYSMPYDTKIEWQIKDFEAFNCG